MFTTSFTSQMSARLNLALALVGTIALALLVMLLPLRRAIRSRPGDALRYG